MEAGKFRLLEVADAFLRALMPVDDDDDDDGGSSESLGSLGSGFFVGSIIAGTRYEV
jgi:hypothetical protein